MKIIEVRKKIHFCYLSFALFWLLQAAYGLFFDTAIDIQSPHYRMYEIHLVPLLKDARTYWLAVNYQLVVGSLFTFISIVRFPFLDPIFKKIQAEQAKGKQPFAWFVAWIRENKTALLLIRTIGLLAWLIVISGVILLVLKFAKQ